MIKVVHITENPIAGAPMNLCAALNKWQKGQVECRHIAASDRNENRVFKSDLLTKVHKREEIADVIAAAHVLHFHNFYKTQELFKLYPELWAVAKKKRRVWQVHSPRATGWMPITEALADTNAVKLVIGQYHPREWPECKVVPNVIDITDPLLMPIKRDWDAPLKVIYSPSRIRLPGWDNKGYDETFPVLQKLVDDSIIAAEIIYDRPHEECLRKRQLGHIAIDEIITGSYHLCSLEALSQGLCTIAGLDDLQVSTLKTLTGANNLPWLVARKESLERVLRTASSSAIARSYALDSRGWMEKYWHPRDMTARFVEIYRSL